MNDVGICNMMAKSRCDADRLGMTLIEVLVSLMILSIVMGSIFMGLIQARSMARATAHQANALQIARSNIEALRQIWAT